MEEEIEELLKEKYKNIDIAVYFIQFNLYEIEIIGLGADQRFNYEYDNYFTKYENINSISEKIDKMILSHFRKSI